MSNGQTVKKSLPNRVLANGLGLVALATLVITNLGVIMRYVFEVSMPWNEEAVKFLFVWMIFIGFAQAFREESLAGILFLEEKFRRRKKRAGYLVVKGIQGLVNIGFGAFCVWHGWDIMLFQMDTEEATTVLEIPLYLVTAGFTIGFALFTLYAVLELARKVRAS